MGERAVQVREPMGAVLIAGFLLAIGLLFWRAVPKPNEQLVTYMLGQLSGFVAAVVAFRFGRNRLNDKATDNTGEAFRAIAATARAAGDPAPAPANEEGPPHDL